MNNKGIFMFDAALYLDYKGFKMIDTSHLLVELFFTKNTMKFLRKSQLGQFFIFLNGYCGLL